MKTKMFEKLFFLKREGEKVCFHEQVKEFAWGVCKDMGHTENSYISTSRNDLILKQTIKAGI